MMHSILIKHYTRNSIIFTALVTLLIVVIIGLMVHVSVRDLLVMVLMAISIGAAIGGLIGWILQRFIFSLLGYSIDESTLDVSVQANIEKEVNVEYELSNDDVLSFYSYNYEQFPTLGRARKLIRRTFLFAIAIELLAAVIVGAAFGNQYLLVILVLCVFAVLTILYYLLSPLLIRKSFRGTVARNYGQGKDRLTGKHKLTITPDAVNDVTEMGESIARWNAVEWIESTDQYLFVTVRGSGPHIVPRRAFADEQEFKQFVDTAKAYHQSAEAGL